MEHRNHTSFFQIHLKVCFLPFNSVIRLEVALNCNDEELDLHFIPPPAGCTVLVQSTHGTTCR